MKMQYRLLPEENLFDEDGVSPLKVRPIVDSKNTVVCRVNIHYPDAATRDECERRAQVILNALNA